MSNNNQEKETRKFEAETGQLLDLMIRSVYSSKEIFLRELISNASDALDKLRFESLTDSSLLQGVGDPEIRLEADSEARTLTVHDNGVGMSRDEVLTNIGTIAKSGTKELLSRLKEAQSKEIPMELIGEFGVGFYSSFMVADNVTLVTRRAGQETATQWESSGDGTYTVSPAERDTIGTSVTLHLKPVDKEDGVDDFTSEWVIRNIVKKYSDFVRYPVVLKVKREKTEDGEKKVTYEDTTLNSQKAIWLRLKDDVKDEELNEFYKQISHDWQDPLTHISMQAEGRFEYRALLFIPSHAPMDLFYKDFERGLQLYVKNVKILDKCEDLMPEYLRFVRGVVDSPDMPLNVSREMLQLSRHTAQIRSTLTKKVLDTLAQMMEKEEEKYLEFFKELGAVLKEGVARAPEHRDKIVDLLMFESSQEKEKLTTLKDYVARMKEKQNEIYYLTGESRQAIEGSPHLEAVLSKGYEVLFMTDPADEFMLPSLLEYDGKKLKSVGKGEEVLGTEEEKDKLKEDLKQKSENYADFIKALQKELDDYVSEVRLTARLTSSPACLVGTEESLSPHIERMLKKNRIDIPVQKRILELNPEHEIVQKLKARFDVRPTDLELADHAQLLFGQALLAEGSPLPEPAKFAGLVADMMTRGL